MTLTTRRRKDIDALRKDSAFVHITSPQSKNHQTSLSGETSMDEEAPGPTEESLGFSISEDLIQSISQKPSQTVALEFNGLLNPPVSLQTLETECGGQLWPAGMVLAEYLLKNEKDGLKGKSIVELGAGSGLVSLALALGLRSDTNAHTSIHITDGLPSLLPLIAHNITLNPSIASSTELYTSILSWGEPLPNSIPNPPDVLLAADCCYIESSFPLLLATMEALIGTETRCWLCFKRRRRADLGFVKGARKRFEVREVQGEWQRKRIFLFEVRKKN